MQLDRPGPMRHEKPMDGHTLDELRGLYGDLDRAVAVFAAATGLVCPDGCGRCCENFVPDLTTIEAELMAGFILENEPRLAGRLDPGGGQACSLYRADEPLHCPVYPVRPLACRCFAFSSTRNKRGRPVFRYCAHMPASALRQFDESQFLTGLGAIPPLMQDFGERLTHLSLDSRTQALPEALRAAFERSGLARHYRRQMSAPEREIS
jgi:uncharacterized protein